MVGLGAGGSCLLLMVVLPSAEWLLVLVVVIDCYSRDLNV
jgi:hypothetical protein